MSWREQVTFNEMMAALYYTNTFSALVFIVLANSKKNQYWQSSPVLANCKYMQSKDHFTVISDNNEVHL